MKSTSQLLKFVLIVKMILNEKDSCFNRCRYERREWN